MKDDSVQRAIDEATQEALRKAEESDPGAEYATIRKRVETKAMKIIQDISSAMSSRVLK